MILDPHNEFAAAFPDTAIVVDTDTLELPFWLFRLEEFVEVIFRGRPGVPEEVDVLRDLIPEAKRNFRGAADNAFFRRSTDKSTLTADTPVPYRIADLLALIDERIGRLDGRNEKPYLRQLKARVSSAINDPRFHFMFFTNTINDTLAETIARLFRIPSNGQPITTFQLSGIPSEVVNSVASVLCRMAFEVALWSNGGIRILVVCEEAHRYVPADPNLGFIPTRQAIARIAKEGRKYGVSLGVVTQRPGELDPTILSQCSTVFAMRLSNERDQEIIRSAIPDSSTSTTGFLSSIGNGEAIAFGEAIAVPMRMRFSKLEQHQLPRANAQLAQADVDADDVDLRAIVQGMRALSNQEIAASATGPAPMPQLGDDPYQAPLAANLDRRPRPSARSSGSRKQQRRAVGPAGAPRKTPTVVHAWTRRWRIGATGRNRAARGKRRRPRAVPPGSPPHPGGPISGRCSCARRSARGPDGSSGTSPSRERRLLPIGPANSRFLPDRMRPPAGPGPGDCRDAACSPACSGGADAIAALPLGLIQLLVRAPVELRAVLPSVPRRKADADGDAQPDIAGDDLHVGDGGTDAIGKRLQLALRCVRGKYRELLAAEARHHVVIAGEFHQAARDALEHLVADVMAMRVVDHLEVIEVEDHHSDGFADLAERPQIFDHRVVEVSPVVHAGESIGRSGLLQVLRALAQRFRHPLQLALFAQPPADDRVDKENSAEHRQPRENGSDEVEPLEPGKGKVAVQPEQIHGLGICKLR